MNYVSNIIEKFGGITKMTETLGYEHPSVVANWKYRGRIPSKQQNHVLDTARKNKIDLRPDDFFSGGNAA